jgi:hypothetical protein
MVSLPAVMFLLHLLSLAIFFKAIIKASKAVRPDVPHLGWTVIFLLVATRYIPGSNLTLGGFDLFEQNFYGYTLGIALVVLTLVRMQEGQLGLAGVIAGLNVYVHANYGQHAIILATGVILLQEGGWKARCLKVLKTSTAFLITALPTLIPLAFHELAGSSEDSAAAFPGYSEIMGFRNPHHMRPGTWVVTDHILFFLSATFLWYLTTTCRNTVDDTGRFWRKVVIIVLLLCGIAYLNELIASDIVAKSYFFRSSGIIKIPFLIYLASFVHDLLLKRHYAGRVRSLDRVALAVIGLFTAAGVVLNVQSSGSGTPIMILNRPAFSGMNFGLQTTPFEQWISAHTPLDAVFLTPPDYFTFSVNTKRAGVVNWLNAPHRGADYLKWYERLKDVTGGAVTVESTRGMDDARRINEMARRAYDRHGADAIVELGVKYKASYCITTTELPLERVMRADPYLLYRLPHPKDG